MKRGWIEWALAGGLVAAMGATARPAQACSCVERPREDAFAAAAAVFEGIVRTVEPPVTGSEIYVNVLLAVVRRWKGVETETVRVATAGNSATCGYTFEIGRSYLVYAEAPAAADRRLFVSLCGRTRPMEDAAVDLTAMGEGVVPVDPVAADPNLSPRLATPEPSRAGCASCAVAASRSTASEERAPRSPLAWVAALLSLAVSRGSRGRASLR